MPGQGWVVGAASKPCSRCKAVKPLADFGRNPATRSGRQSWCLACDCRRKVEKYAADAEFRAAAARRTLAWKRTEAGALVHVRSSLRCQLRGAVKAATKDRLRQRIAELDGRIAALRAGRGHQPEQVRSVA